MSAVPFVVSVSLPLLFTGRVVSGLAAGLVTGTATAYLTEIHPDARRGGQIAAAVNLFGLGLGPLISGLLTEHLSDPARLPYLAGVVLLVPALLVLTVPNTAGSGQSWQRAVRPQRLGVPSDMRRDFAAAALAGVVSFAFLGFMTSLTADLLGDGLHDHSRRTAGIVAFLLFAAPPRPPRPRR